MNVPESLVSLRNDLLRRGLPVAYVERAVGELADHAEDLASQTRVTEPAVEPATVLLGDPRRLADQIVREFQSRTFLGRHPWLTFIVAPVAACFTLWFTAILAIGLLFEMVLPEVADHVPPAPIWVAAARGISWVATFGTPLVLACLAVRRARKTGRTRPWAWVAAGVIAAMQLLVSMDLVIDYELHTIQVTVRGLAGLIGVYYLYLPDAALLPDGSIWRGLATLMTPWQLLQIAIPPAIVAWTMRRLRFAQETAMA